MRFSKTHLSVGLIVILILIGVASLQRIPSKLLEIAAPHLAHEYDTVVHDRVKAVVQNQEFVPTKVEWNAADWIEFSDPKQGVSFSYPKKIMSSASCVKEKDQLVASPNSVAIPVGVESNPKLHAVTLLLNYQGIAGDCRETTPIIEPTQGALAFNTWLRIEVVSKLGQGELVFRLKGLFDECREPKESPGNKAGLTVLRFPERTVRCMVTAITYDPKSQRAAFWYLWQTPAVFGDQGDYLGVMIDRFRF